MKYPRSKRLIWLALVFILAGVALLGGQRLLQAQAPSDPSDLSVPGSGPLARANASAALPDGPLANPGFEGGWEHTPVDLYNTYGHYLYTSPFGEIFVPEGWGAFFRHGPPVAHDEENTIGWAQPEVHIINKEEPFLDPPRIYEGQRALKLFTFWRIHDAGLYQQVRVPPGVPWRLSAWVHTWTSQEDDPTQSTGDPLQAWLLVGLDPTGSTNPFGGSVVWSEAGHIYDVYSETPSVAVTPVGDTLTVFIRSYMLAPYKHNDVYWDAVTLEPVYTGDGPELTAEPAGRTAYQGQGVSYTLALTTSGTTLDLTSPFSLSMGSLPGVSAAFVPAIIGAGETAQLVLTPSLSTPAGTYSAALSASGFITADDLRYPVQATTRVSLTVQPADFTLAVTPTVALTPPGETALFQVQPARLTPGFVFPVALDVHGIPTNARFAVTPTTLVPGTRATLRITTTPTAPLASHALTITGVSGVLERTFIATLAIWARFFLPLLLK